MYWLDARMSSCGKYESGLGANKRNGLVADNDVCKGSIMPMALHATGCPLLYATL